QSGSTEILKAMNRGYSKEDYLSLVEKIRREIPEVSITTDIIVGFPGETDADFEHTLDAVEKADFSSAFTFIYSKRTGTPAAELPEVNGEVVKARFNRLTELIKPRMYEANKRQIGKRLRVLADETSKNNEEQLTGRTDGNVPVHFAADKSVIGEMLEIEITGCKTFYLVGEVRNLKT
ncbi:MAG: TRAM domain-containing protein, partial [Defluviitaleaceae bacterium]|nr:TRAM domain-containing protein [Defluviitaleaceae bacterium]